MYLYELNYPGTWLQLENDQVRFEIEGVLRALEGILTEAAIALSMFEESHSQRPDPRNEWDRDAELRQQIDDEIRKQAGDDYYQNFDTYRLLSEKKNEGKKSGTGYSATLLPP